MQYPAVPCELWTVSIDVSTSAHPLMHCSSTVSSLSVTCYSTLSRPSFQYDNSLTDSCRLVALQLPPVRLVQGSLRIMCLRLPLRQGLWLPLVHHVQQPVELQGSTARHLGSRGSRAAGGATSTRAPRDRPAIGNALSAEAYTHFRGRDAGAGPVEAAGGTVSVLKMEHGRVS